MVLIGGDAMKPCTQEITLYVDKKNKYKYVYGKQSDARSRFLKVTIVDGGKKVVPESDDSAKFRALKPDGTAVFNDCAIESDGTILVELSAQTLAVAGQVSADVVIIGKNEEVLATANFCIVVEKAPIGESIESSNEFIALVNAMNQAVKKEQGKENSGKLLGVDDDGFVTPVENHDSKKEIFNIPISVTGSGDNYTADCDVASDDIIAAYEDGKVLAVVANYNVDDETSVPYFVPLAYVADDTLVFISTLESVIKICFFSSENRWSFSVSEAAPSTTTAADVSYELPEEVQTEFSEIELEENTVKAGLDTAMYYALAGMYAKYIGVTLQGAAGTVDVSLQNFINNTYIPVANKAHEHDNKSILDEITAEKVNIWDNKQAKPSQVTSGTTITLADNTEYRLTDVTTLKLSYPVGDFESWMRLNFAASGDITVTLPAGTGYIGTAPDFKNGETWELSFKDKILAAQKVGDGT